MEELVVKLFESVGAVGGPGALVALVFAVLWVMERSERKELAAKNEALGREVLTAIGETGSSLDKLAQHGDEIRASVNKVAEAVTVLSVRGRRA